MTANAIHGGRGRGGSVARPVHDLDDWAATLSPALSNVELLTTHRENARMKSSTLLLERLDGIATVADPAALNDLLRFGVGRAKAFGGGLLTVLA